MSENKLKLKDAADVHDFNAYYFSRAVYRDFPKLITKYNQILESLYPYGQYAAVAQVIDAVEKNRSILALQYRHFQKIYEKKGKVETADNDSKK